MANQDTDDWMYSFYSAAERRAFTLGAGLDRLARPIHEQPRDYAEQDRQELIHGPRPWWWRVWRWLNAPTDL